MEHKEDHHRNDDNKKGGAKREAEKEKSHIQDNLVEKAKHGHSEAMDHSKMNHEEGSNSDHQPAHGHGGHDHHKMMIEDFRKRFWVTLVLTFPILFISPMIQDFFGYEYLLPGNRYILFALSSVVYFYGGWPFLKGFWTEIQKGAPGMMTLISMAITVAYFYSSATVFGLEGVDFFWELATLIAIMLVGHWIEMKSVLGASKALQLLVSMMPAEAHRINGDEVEDV
ncbi:MAG TPA: hypothetical protein VLN46_06965, partial [Gillisia sp.]|nr:hypothetical protein [Gillisia sp.]